MHHAAQFLAFLAVAFGIAFARWPVLGLRGLAFWLGLGLCGTTVLFTPLIVAPQHVMLRALACVLAIELWFKTTDYALQRRISSIEDRPFRSYARFLVPFPVLLVRFGQRTRGSQFNLSSWYATAIASIVFLLCFAIVDLVSQFAMVRSSFLLDHTVKFIVFTLAIESLARLLYGLERLTGYKTKRV